MKTKFDIICFDVDSTIVTCEGVDWLAEQKGVGKEVRELTELAMNGSVSMESVFGKKLDVLKPSRKEMEMLGEYYCSQITEGVEKTLANIKSLGITIWLVSGGFHTAILPLARKLNIPTEQVHANEVFTNSSGDYTGINQDCSLTKSTGKVVCANTIGKHKRIAFVGDSVTDLATKPVVTTFIGYGGVAVRKRVKEEAEFFIKTPSLEPLLWLVV